MFDMRWPWGDPLLAGPGADDVEGSKALGAVVRPTTGLAVDRHETPGRVGVDRDRVGDPGLKAALEGLGLQRHEQAADAVARGDAVGQVEMLGQPGCPMLGPAMDGGRAVAAADDAAGGDDGDIDQQVFAIPHAPRVGERFEVRADGADVDELGHERRP